MVAKILCESQSFEEARIFLGQFPGDAKPGELGIPETFFKPLAGDRRFESHIEVDASCGHRISGSEVILDLMVSSPNQSIQISLSEIYSRLDYFPFFR